MNSNILEIIESGSQTELHSFSGGEKLFPFSLELFGNRLDLCVACRAESVTLKDLVYPFRQLCDIAVQRTIEHQQLCGQAVSCSAGCMACCKYIITVSLAESFAIRDKINSMPRENQQVLLRKMTMTSRKILATYPNAVEPVSLADLSKWYNRLNMPCPWLENKRCLYYSDRPLVCREHMVITPPEGCNPSVSGAIQAELPIRMSEVLMEVSARLAGRKLPSMFLPLIVAWDEDFKELRTKQFDAGPAALLLIEGAVSYRQKRVMSV